MRQLDKILSMDVWFMFGVCLVNRLRKEDETTLHVYIPTSLFEKLKEMTNGRSWKVWLTELQKDFSELATKNQEIREENADLRQENKDLRVRLMKLQEKDVR